MDEVTNRSGVTARQLVYLNTRFHMSKCVPSSLIIYSRIMGEVTFGNCIIDKVVNGLDICPSMKITGEATGTIHLKSGQIKRLRKLAHAISRYFSNFKNGKFLAQNF